VAEPLRVLVVCTANICRSPAAERYLCHHAREMGVAVEVSSAGFLYDGEPASETMTKVMGERGFDLADHRSRIADCDLVGSVDLVVTMERRHGRELAGRCGPSGVFTLKGAVDALRTLDPQRAAQMDPRARLAAIDTARQAGDLLGTGDDEVPDPVGKSTRVNRRAADDLRDLTAELLHLLFERETPAPTAETTS
jgi:protein-tyrosine phosphatase